jgi:hypothetical protein
MAGPTEGVLNRAPAVAFAVVPEAMPRPINDIMRSTWAVRDDGWPDSGE